MNILLVEDETQVADFVVRGLKAEGWSVEHVGDGESALRRVGEEAFDIVVLDLMLPGISGREVCRKLRARGERVLVLMLSALDATEERVEGLRIGADDYLPKPFDFDELVARLEALGRRGARFEEKVDDDVLRLDAIAIDRRSLRASVDGQALELTGKERDLLTFLLLNPDRALSRERILNTVWGVQEDPQTNVVDVYIGRLRRKLGVHGERLRTVRGLGYRLGTRDRESHDVPSD